MPTVFIYPLPIFKKITTGTELQNFVKLLLAEVRDLEPRSLKSEEARFYIATLLSKGRLEKDEVKNLLQHLITHYKTEHQFLKIIEKTRQLAAVSTLEERRALVEQCLEHKETQEDALIYTMQDLYEWNSSSACEKQHGVLKKLANEDILIQKLNILQNWHCMNFTLIYT